ncbi:MAG: DUF1648 domain-containing protein [Opitutaceae bacterium]
MRPAAKILFLLTAALALAQATWHYLHLPETVAIHFDLAGQANGWSSRGAHFAMQAGLAVFLGALFGSGGWLLRRVPDQFINIPHRDYWLAPERRAATCRALDSMFSAVGIVVMGFFVVLFQQVYVANLTGTLTLKLMPLIIGQFVFVVGLISIMMFRFRPPAQPDPRSRRRS